MDETGRGALPRKLLLVFGFTLAFMVVEAVAGWISGSLALVADAGHMLTDAGALGLSLVTAWLARRPANPSKTYGYTRWEVLAALINGAALLVIAIWVTVEAIHRIKNPKPIEAGLFMVVAGLGLVVNLVGLWILHDVRHGSLNVRGAYLHVLGDALGSVGALVAAVIIGLTGWTLADPIVSVLLSLLILIGAWRLVRESTDVLLDSVPSHLSLGHVRERLLGVRGVNDVHDLHVWTVTNGVVAMSGHAVVPNLDAHPLALRAMREELEGLGISHVTIQLETESHCEGLDCLKPAPTRAGDHGHHHGHGHHHAGHGHHH